MNENKQYYDHYYFCNIFYEIINKIGQHCRVVKSVDNVVDRIRTCAGISHLISSQTP